MRLLLISTLALFSLLSCKSEAPLVEEVKVLDANFVVKSHLKNSNNIREFNNFWKERVISRQSTKPSYNYKFDIISNGNSTRWLYDSNSGLSTVLTVKVSEVYLIPNYKELNKRLDL